MPLADAQLHVVCKRLQHTQKADAPRASSVTQWQQKSSPAAANNNEDASRAVRRSLAAHREAARHNADRRVDADRRLPTGRPAGGPMPTTTSTTRGRATRRDRIVRRRRRCWTAPVATLVGLLLRRSCSLRVMNDGGGDVVVGNSARVCTSSIDIAISRLVIVLVVVD